MPCLVIVLTAEEEQKKQELITKIMMEIPYVDVKPYSHNIIGCRLRQLELDFGQETAYEVVRTTNLKNLGWMMSKDDNKAGERHEAWKVNEARLELEDESDDEDDEE